ncbi:MAG: DUF5011 domain-containing protein, partial [Nitrosopumilus sp.]|nr:DUF5011 domain-containing protein [Nitrosopumilus sp.]
MAAPHDVRAALGGPRADRTPLAVLILALAVALAPAHAELLVVLDGPAHVVVAPGTYVERGAACIENGAVTGRAGIVGEEVQPNVLGTYRPAYSCVSGSPDVDPVSVERVVTVIDGGGVEGISGTAAACGTSRSQLCVPTDIPRCDIDDSSAEGTVAYSDGLAVTRLPGGYVYIEHTPDGVLPSYYEVRSSMTGRAAQVFNYTYVEDRDPDVMVAVPPGLLSDISGDPEYDSFTARAVYVRASTNYGDSTAIRVVPNPGITFDEYLTFTSFTGPAALRTDGSEYIVDIVDGAKTVITDTRFTVGAQKQQCVMSEDVPFQLDPPRFEMIDVEGFGPTPINDADLDDWAFGDPFPEAWCKDDQDGRIQAVAGPLETLPHPLGPEFRDIDAARYVCTDSHGNSVTAHREVPFDLSDASIWRSEIPDPIRVAVGAPYELPPVFCENALGDKKHLAYFSHRPVLLFSDRNPENTVRQLVNLERGIKIYINATAPTNSESFWYSCDYISLRNEVYFDVIAVENDRTPPVMELHGYDVMRHVKGEPFIDPLASCVDATSGAAAVSSSGLDVDMVGNHTVRYWCDDYASNRAFATRIVEVAESFDPDTALPELELLNATASVPQYTRYDGGATCTDAVNGRVYHVSESVKKDGSFTPRNITDTTMHGTYEITYSCTDQAGNTGTISHELEVTRADKPAEDAEKPLARLDGAPSVSVLPGDRFQDPGATCVSDEGVEAAPNPNVLDTSESGYQIVQYVCGTGDDTDSVYRTVNVLDKAIAFPDEIYLHGYERAHHRTGTIFVDHGATCIGRLDGARVADVEGEVDDAVPGEYELTYTCPVGDASITRTVTVADTKPPDSDPPVLRLDGDRLVDIQQYRPYRDAGATCTDRQDGALNPLVQVQYTGAGGSRPFATDEVVNPTVAGTYTIRYTCTDSAGNEARGITERLVRVEPSERPASDLGRPSIWLVGSTGVDFTKFSLFQQYPDPGAKCADDRDGVYDATASGTVVRNSRDPATYLLTYTCPDSAGGAPAVAARSVVLPISDEGDPEIIIRGFSRVLHALGEPYVDLSASCIDHEEGALPLTTRGNVTADVAGTYSIEYSCADSADNRASESRTVIVAAQFAADTTPPVITPGGTMGVTQVYESHNGPPPLSPLPTCTDTTNNDISQVTTTTFVYNDGRTVFYFQEDYLVPNLLPHRDHVLVHTCTDQAGNTASTTVVVDHIGGFESFLDPPSILLRGQDVILHPLGDPFVDPGASCADDRDGRLPTEAHSSVDVEKLGIYGVEYSCTDSYQNTVYAHRVVRVVPPDSPVAFLNGEEDVPHRTASLPGEEGYYEDPGATCAFPDGSSSRETSRSSVPVFDGTKRGTYVVTYTCTSPEGSDSVSRTIRVSDGLPPVVTLIGNMTHYVDRGGSFEDPGATCNDVSDGVIDEITSDPDVVDVIRFGNYTVDYSCTDSEGNTGTAVRHVIVDDGTPPLITLRGPASVKVQLGATYADPGAACTDDVDDARDADISGVHGAEIGPYTISYTCTDSAGNSGEPATRMIEVVKDAEPPVITRTGPGVVQHVLRQPYQDLGARCVDAADGIRPVTTSGLDMINVDAAGTYKVNYTCTDKSGNFANSTRTVDVRSSHPADAVPPRISVAGADPLVHASGSPFEDPGATCTDTAGGVIDMVDVVVRGPGGRTAVDDDLVAQYAIAYDCEDASGNRASDDRRAANTRTVQVVEPPVITLRGLAVTQLPQGQ